MENKEAEYNKMYNDFLAGEISETEWTEYCTNLLGKKIEEHKDVFIRLKDR